MLDPGNVWQGQYARTEWRCGQVRWNVEPRDQEPQHWGLTVVACLASDVCCKRHDKCEVNCCNCPRRFARNRHLTRSRSAAAGKSASKKLWKCFHVVKPIITPA